MAGGSKIIGMWKDRDDNADRDSGEKTDIEGEDTLELGIGDRAFSSENETVSDETADEDWNDYYEAEERSHSAGTKIEIALVLALAAVWTGFFLWVNRDIFTTLIPAQRGIELLSQWSMPIVLLGIFHLLFMRNSRQEANRFADVANSLRAESEQLENRLKTVNNELTIAREFLASETRELEFLGDQSSQKLTTAAERIKSSLKDGLSSMRQLDEVGESAFQNLDQLREHLPVVINTAKDVTNQIGNAGRAAQTEMAAMVTTLKKVGEIGNSAKDSIDGLTDTSNQSLSKLSEMAKEVQKSFSIQFSEAESETQRISKVLQDSSSQVVQALQETRAQLAQETSDSAESIKSGLEDLEAAMMKIGKAADDEETRLKALIEELQQRITEINTEVSSLDNESGEKTAKLAFALTALEENSQSLQDSLEKGHGVADGMIERMEKLLVALDSSTREMDETLPAAFSRVDKRSQSSLTAFKKLKKRSRDRGPESGGYFWSGPENQRFTGGAKDKIGRAKR